MAFLHKKTVIIIAGPTAVGKTSVAIKLAKSFQTEIVSADSRQCYRELKIGVARPSEEELKKVTHHFIASHSITDIISAAGFEKFALQKVNELFNKHDVVIMVGGTGLYIKAFCEGLDEIPEVNPDIRNLVIANYNKNGLEWLKNEVIEKDPGFYKEGEIQNPQRMMRALEVMESTGQSILSFQKGKKAERIFNIIKFGLELPREELYRHINTRVEKMIEQGLVEEVKSLLPLRHYNALHTVGYTEIFNYLDGNISLEQATEEIKKNTRHYAKRQMTWFRKDKEFQWISPQDSKSMTAFLETKI